MCPYLVNRKFSEIRKYFRAYKMFFRYQGGAAQAMPHIICIYCIQIIKSYIRSPFILPDKSTFPFPGFFLQLKSSLFLLPMPSHKIPVIKFTVPGLCIFIEICWHISFLLLCIANFHIGQDFSLFQSYFLFRKYLSGTQIGKEKR